VYDTENETSSNVGKIWRSNRQKDGGFCPSVMLSLHVVPARKEWRNSNKKNGTVKSFVSHCGVWRFTVVPDESLWCLEIRCGA
jgi:hypothetical protein